MSHPQPEHDRKQRPSEAEQFAQNNSEYSLNQPLTRETHPDDNSTAALQRVSQGVMNGESPIRFMDAINASNSAMGNRGFLQFVGRLRQQRQETDARKIAKTGLAGAGQPMTHQDTIQQAFGHHDISGMREHADSAARMSLTMLGAEGFSSDGRMAFHGVPDLYTQAHEAAHGVQQTALGNGLQLKGGIGETGDRYETHADAVAEAVVRGESAQPLLDQVAPGPTQVTTSSVSASAPVQMQRKKKNNTEKPEDKPDLDMPTLDLGSSELVSPVANPSPLSNADGEMEPQLTETIFGNESISLADDISDTNSDTDSEYEDEADEFMARYFPVTFSIYNLIERVANQVETENHGVSSPAGIGNVLASMMITTLMVGIGLPVDLFVNILNGIANIIMLMSNIFFGKPATWLLNFYFKHYPPSAEDHARATSQELPKGPPRGIDWNVSIPELIAISGISAYWQAGSTQSSLSPRLWLQPWTSGRIASIIIRTIINDIVYLLQFTIFPQFSQRILQNRLRWGEAQSGLFVSILNNIFDVVSSYILSYLTNLPLAVYLVFQNYIEDNDLTPSEAAAAVMGYAALGMFIQTTSEAIFEHFVVSKVNEKNLVPWLNQFRAIPNRFVRTIAIALASFRNVVINVLSISLTTGQLSANIIGPLSTSFGQGGACVWPLAVSEVCGGPPADFNQTAQDVRVATGKENLSFGQLFAIELFPWLVGLIGLGIPIAYIIYKYRRAKKAEREANSADLGERGLEQQDDNSMLVENDVPDSLSYMLTEIQLPVEVNEDTISASQQSVSNHSGAQPMSTNMTAQMIFEMLIRRDRLNPTELKQILKQHVDNNDITQAEAQLIEEMVREEVVLSKER